MSITTRKTTGFRFIREFLHFVATVVGAGLLTLIFFLVLPVMQTLSQPPLDDLLVQSVDTAQLDAPEPPPEVEQEEEMEQEEEPPKLEEPAQPLDLSQLEIALNPGGGTGGIMGDFTVNLKTEGTGVQGADELFSIAELDKKPRIIYQPSPVISGKMRRYLQKASATVYVIFIVNEKGRVENPKIDKSTDSMFNKAVLDAIKKYKFEPGQRSGKPVRSRKKIPITFPKGG